MYNQNYLLIYFTIIILLIRSSSGFILHIKKLKALSHFSVKYDLQQQNNFSLLYKEMKVEKIGKNYFCGCYKHIYIIYFLKCSILLRIFCKSRVKCN